jgi:dGTPase
MTSEELDYYESGMNKIYKEYLNDLETNNEDSKIVNEFLKDQSEEYKENTNNKRIVIDYIAGMTDTYFNNEIKRIKD